MPMRVGFAAELIRADRRIDLISRWRRTKHSARMLNALLVRLIFKPTRFPVSAQSFLQNNCKYYRSNRVIVFTEPGVVELLKTKSDATSATLVVSTEIYNFSS